MEHDCPWPEKLQHRRPIDPTDCGSCGDWTGGGCCKPENTETLDYVPVSEKDSAYLERNRVVALLARMCMAGIKKTAIKGWDPAWHNCVFIVLPSGHQVSWHYHDDQAYLFEGLPPYTGEWDGHTTEQKYARIESYCRRVDQNREQARAQAIANRARDQKEGLL